MKKYNIIVIGIIIVIITIMFFSFKGKRERFTLTNDKAEQDIINKYTLIGLARIFAIIRILSNNNNNLNIDPQLIDVFAYENLNRNNITDPKFQKYVDEMFSQMLKNPPEITPELQKKIEIFTATPIQQSQSPELQKKTAIIGLPMQESQSPELQKKTAIIGLPMQQSQSLPPPPPPILIGRYITLFRNDAKNEYINILRLEAYDRNNKFIKPVSAELQPDYDNKNFGPNFLLNQNNSRLVHTNRNSKASITIDLGRDVPIGHIVVGNRKDCCQDRIIGTKVSMTKNNGVYVKDWVINTKIDEIKLQ